VRRTGLLTHAAGAWALLLAILSAPGVSAALEPEQVLVLANRNASRGLELARYYADRRGIPEDQVLTLRTTEKETCSREAYEKEIVEPVRAYLEEHAEKDVRCLVVVSGLPLRISPPRLTPEEKTLLKRLESEKKEAGKRLRAVKKSDDRKSVKPLKEELGRLEGRIRQVKKRNHRASLDSEIALVLAGPYDPAGWVPNPYFPGYQGKTLEGMPNREDVLLVSRLDGPGREVVRRIIDDSLEAEAEGLEGTAYFDARWPMPSEVKKPRRIGNGFYDRSIHKAAERVEKSGRMGVVVNDEQALFGPGDCPDAALYCGWYRLARYVDAFDWRKGAVGFHIASQECQSLRRGRGRYWCKRMLEDGAAAVIGPVGEPYLQAFPVPEIFFALLLDGRWTLAECYALSLPFLSWQMVLVGDPLYRPFKRKKGESPSHD
jgi:uncharacterized protein (TIGR03790 family)